MKITHNSLIAMFGLSGKLGNLVFASYKGVPYARSVPVITADPSPAQIAQRAKFGFALRLMQPMRPLMANGYGPPKRGKTPFNVAMSYHYKNAVRGNYPGFYTDFNRVQPCRGPLPRAGMESVAAIGSGLLEFSWLNARYCSDRDYDSAILVAICEDTLGCIYTLHGAHRYTGKGMLNVNYFSGRKVHTYISFLSSDKRKTADSVYTGAVLVK